MYLIKEKEIEFLDIYITEEGVKMDEVKVKAIMEWPVLLSVGYGNSSQGNLTEIRAREQKEPGFNL